MPRASAMPGSITRHIIEYEHSVPWTRASSVGTRSRRFPRLSVEIPPEPLGPERVYPASHASMGREIISVSLKEKCMPLAGGQSGLATRNTNEAGGETFSRFFPVLKRFIMRRRCPAITIWNGSKLLFRLPESGLSKCEGRWPAQAQVLRGVTTAVWSGQAQRMTWSRLGPPRPTPASRLGKIER